MIAATDLRCLVLNADWRPLQTYPISLISGQEAVRAVYRGRATVAEEWDQVFRSPSCEIPVPKTIALREYVSISAAPKFCRRSVYLRDRFCCQYCGERFHTSELTFDHVFPRSKGGTTTWDNVLTCCVKCNVGKRDSLIGSKRETWRPIKMPRQPTSYELLRAGLEFLDPSIREDFGSWLYWNSELQA